MKIPQLLRGFVASTALRRSLPAPYPNDLRCSVLDDDGNIRADSSYSWLVRDFSLDSVKQPDSKAALTTARFTLRTPLLPEPVSCGGSMHPADVYEFQACSTSPAAPLEDPWISFDYNFLLDNYLQINQTWRCQRETSKSITIQATGGLGLGWYRCNGSDTATLERPIGPGHCDVVVPTLPDETDVTRSWSRSAYIINASSLVTIDQ